MKSLLMVFALSLSVSAFAKIPASEAVTNLIPAGVYSAAEGEDSCSVSVATSDDTISVKVTTSENSLSFTTLNSTESYSVNNKTGEFTAFQNKMFPGGGRGGQKLLTIRRLENNDIEVFVSNVYFNHQGEDVGTYLTCAVKL